MNKQLLNTLKVIFLGIEGAIFFLLLFDSFLRFLREYRNIICYIAVIICALFALIFTLKGKEKRSYFLLFSFLFILIADYFLIFYDSAVGIYFFILTQLMYQLFIKRFKLLVFFFLSGLGLLLFTLLLNHLVSLNIDLSSTLPASFYYGIQIFNIISLLILIKKGRDKKEIFVLLGLVFLFFCDTSIGLYNLTSLRLFNDLIWLFYLPSQSLIIYYLASIAKKGIKDN